jgi:hypothetical protein
MVTEPHSFKLINLRFHLINLPHMALVLDTIVSNKWWFDRDALRGKLTEQY